MLFNVFKFLIALFGVTTSIALLVIGLVKGDKSRFKHAFYFLTATFISQLVLTGLEFLYYSNKTGKEKQILISAAREAPIGGIWLKLYDDESYSLTNDPRSEGSKGTYTIKNDTLTLFISDTIRTSFIIKEKSLTEIESTGIGGLSIVERH